MVSEFVAESVVILCMWALMAAMMWALFKDVDVSRKRGERGIDVIQRVAGSYLRFNGWLLKVYVLAIPKAIMWLVSKEEVEE